jgi:hypothetical protein
MDLATFTPTRLMTLACLAMLLGACSTVRLEDVPSASTIDKAAGKVQASLLVPPGINEVPAVEPLMADASAGDVSDNPEMPFQKDAVWSVQYRDNGFDAENAAGDTCSGWLAYGETGPKPGQSVKMACSDGSLAKLEVGTAEGNARSGAVVFGATSQTALITSY